MANNALIQGAALTSKKFLDVAGAVKQGLVDSGSFSRQTPARVDENKAVQAKVNNYMRNMKTDMDFTSFTPEETATMRSFLLIKDQYTQKPLKMPLRLMTQRIQITCYMLIKCKMLTIALQI